ncbi:MAG: PEP-CTERM sorting domain-containing protein [Nitrosospira sp.]|nr:PEP-CTERM sorting domain-containing protein [Nitrosospira sp.]
MKKSVIATTLVGLLVGVGTGQSNASGYTFTDLGTLGGSHSMAMGINNAGQVVGFFTIIGSDNSYNHAAIWNGTIGTVLVGSLGEYGSYASDINNAGQVVGSASGGGIGLEAILWNGTIPLEFGKASDAYAINDAGQVVGWYDHCVLGCAHATLWNGTTPTDLGTLGGTGSSAFGINNASQVVGYAFTTGNATYHATIWNGTTPTDLGTLGGLISSAYAINDAGQVVGGSYTSDNAAYHATIWNGTTPTDLGTLGGLISFAYAINDAGQVVGDSYTSDNATYHATIWNGTTLTDLNDFLSVSEVNAGWILQAASDINDNGWIVGGAYNTITGAYQGFLLTPVPEPETYAMFMAGFGLMGFIARRRKNGQA